MLLISNYNQKKCTKRRLLLGTSPIRSSRGALNLAFAKKTGRHSFSQHALGRSASNGVKILSAVVTVFIIGTALPLNGFVMESSSYQIQSDSINVGGLRSESASYIQESTVGEIATGPSESTSYKLKAGYQQMQEVYIALSAIGDVTLLPAIGAITGGTGNGGVQFTITTDSSSGFTVTLTASSSVGMLGENISGTILHLSPTTPGVPNYTFTSAPANSSAFAYTINASTTGEITQPFRNNGSACNTGATETDANCWLNATTTAYTIINTSTRTQISGSTSTLRYRAIISANPQPLIPSGVYTATTTLTVLSN